MKINSKPILSEFTNLLSGSLANPRSDLVPESGDYVSGSFSDYDNVKHDLSGEASRNSSDWATDQKVRKDCQNHRND